MVVMHFKVVYAEYYRILESKYGAQIRERIGKIV
jgi:hypothetical protein